VTAGEPTGPAAPTCPYCAITFERALTRDRLCPSCRQPIVVRRVDGRIVLLAAEAAKIADWHLQREADERRWAAERERWLARAAGPKAPAEQIARLAAAKLTASVVDRSRALYLESAERAVRAARRNAKWSVVAQIRRDEAAILYAEAGNPVPPPEDIAALHREAMLAELRSIAATTQFAELVGAGCCPACRTGDATSMKITTELRTPRLPHEGCPKGLCACEWWVSMTAPRRPRRRRAVRGGDGPQ
jgi:rubredoxin